MSSAWTSRKFCYKVKIGCRMAYKTTEHQNHLDSKLLHMTNTFIYFILSGRISRNIGENIFRSYTGTTSENTDYHFLVA